MIYQVTVSEEPQNMGHRLIIHGLRNLYPNGMWEGLEEETETANHNWLISKYDYEKLPFWSSGTCEEKCFTLPWAVFLVLYDLVQVHDDLHDGDVFEFAHDGRTFVTVVASAWPHCEEAKELEVAFRKENGIKSNVY